MLESLSCGENSEVTVRWVGQRTLKMVLPHSLQDEDWFWADRGAIAVVVSGFAAIAVLKRPL